MASTNEKTNTENRGQGFIFNMVAFIIAFITLLLILGGILYLLVKNNINGISNKYRNELEKIPVIRSALPESIVQDDEMEYMTNDEIREAYAKLKKNYDDLEESYNNALENIEELSEFHKDYLNKVDVLKAQSDSIKEDREALVQDTIEFERRVAENDKNSFRDFFEEINQDQAAKIYEGIVKEEQADENVQEYIKIFQNMEPDAAAGIFEEMGTSKLDLLSDILYNMSNATVSSILSEMDKTLASKLAERLAEIYMKTGQ